MCCNLLIFSLYSLCTHKKKSAESNKLLLQAILIHKQALLALINFFYTLQVNFSLRL